MTPVLSICIPTYNRAEALQTSLRHILEDPVFLHGDEVEVVVADNASTDATELLCRGFEKCHPGKFIYHRQPENLGYSANLETLMRIGRGEFLKFQNDNFFFLPGQMHYVLEFVKTHRTNRPVLFFGNDTIQCQSPGLISANTFDEMLDAVSFAATWTGGFGFWQEEKALAIAVHQETAWTLISQTAVLWALFDKRRRGYIYNYKMFSDENAWTVKRGGYNVSEVQGRNYLSIIKKYVCAGKITQIAYEHEKKRLYKGFLFGRYFDFTHKFAYEKGNFFNNTKEFHGNLYFWLSFLQWPFFKVVALLPKPIMKMPLSVYGAWKRMRMKQW